MRNVLPRSGSLVRWSGACVALMATCSIACSGSSEGASTDRDAANGSAHSGSGASSSPDGGVTEFDSAGISDASTPIQSPVDAGADVTGLDASSGGDTGVVAVDGGYPTGWLFTKGGHIYVSDGTPAGKPWMGRGVNIDDIFFCGYNSSLSMAMPDQTLQTVISGLVTGWKPTFVRISLAMDSYGTVTSWLSNASQYKTPMTNVINALGTHPNLHVLVTLRSDASMILQDTADGDPEATGLPSDHVTTPDAGAYPNGTDAVYVALVDTFANAGFVSFGLTNEPGGNKRSNATIAAAMTHAVGVIRAEEDRLKVPHHLVSVQGNSWTSDISFYASSPIPQDNVVYEVHGYPPPTSSYTYANIPVIIGEYGSVTSSSSAAFYADLETKQIPNLAWDFDSFSNCAPDLLTVNHSATNLMPTAWGSIVQSYLTAHP